ncbi:MAG: delta-60 repeat domain-containing protein [Nitrospira sp.]|nr:delta-60 repeat domain-containing protein [Nitrospira sp.]
MTTSGLGTTTAPIADKTWTVENDRKVVSPVPSRSVAVDRGRAATASTGTAVTRLVRLNANGAIDSRFTVGTGFNGSVYSVAPAKGDNGYMYVGGRFTNYNGRGVTRLMRINDDGVIDVNFNAGIGFSNAVYSVASAEDGSGDVYVGGRFSSYNGTAVVRLVRLNADGTVDTDFNVGTGFDGTVYTVAPATDGSGDVYVGGQFSTYNGRAVTRLVRLNADGTIDADFMLGAGFDNTVWSVAPATGDSGDVYVGGAFTRYNGTAANYLVRLKANGAIDVSFNVGMGMDHPVRSVATAMDGSGDVYVGGWFTTYNGTVVNDLVRLNADGTIDLGFTVGTGCNGPVLSVAPATDGSGDVYVGGIFASYHGATVNDMARINGDDIGDAGLALETGVENIVRNVVSTTDGSGDVSVSGRRTVHKTIVGLRIMRLDADGHPL